MALAHAVISESRHTHLGSSHLTYPGIHWHAAFLVFPWGGEVPAESGKMRNSGLLTSQSLCHVILLRNSQWCSAQHCPCVSCRVLTYTQPSTIVLVDREGDREGHRVISGSLCVFVHVYIYLLQNACKQCWLSGFSFCWVFSVFWSEGAVLAHE